YKDPDLIPPRDPSEIDASSMARAIEALNLLRMNDPERLGDWFGRFITVYRSAGQVMPATTAPGEAPRSRIEIEWDLQHGATLHRHPFSRMAWRKAARGAAARGAQLYVNGQDHSLPLRDSKRIANAAQLDGASYASLSDKGRDRVFELLQAGHYRLAFDDGEEE
ncbi:MAG: winged helix domain-containing protein, partial [Lysobacter sp.]